MAGALSIALEAPRMFDAAIWDTGDSSRRFGETAADAAARIKAEREEARARADQQRGS